VGLAWGFGEFDVDPNSNCAADDPTNTITYELDAVRTELGEPSGASISYQTSDRGRENEEAALPLEAVGSDAKGLAWDFCSDAKVFITAREVGAPGQITCRIKVDGKVKVTRTAPSDETVRCELKVP
jgi:hypothetical protein